MKLYKDSVRLYKCFERLIIKRNHLQISRTIMSIYFKKSMLAFAYVLCNSFTV